MSLLRIFIALSNSTYLNETKKVGPKMGANKVVVGNTIEQLIDTIERLNDKNIAVQLIILASL